MPDADRVYARLDRFQVECPKCGEIILSWHRDSMTPARLHDLSHKRSAARLAPTKRAVRHLTFNPVSQRLVCPFCRTRYVVGLLLYQCQTLKTFSEPPDVAPTKRDLARLRRYASGWWMNQLRQDGEPVNLVVDAPCICPKPDGWAVACPVHGDPAQHPRA